MGRANETSIFSPQNQAVTFARYGLRVRPDVGQQVGVRQLPDESGGVERADLPAVA